ncbi:MAG: hypothetical protein ACYC1P_00950 [Gaiellaceae bacterium]
MSIDRWRLLLKVIPVVGLVGVAKLAVMAVDWEPVSLSPLLTGLITAEVFLLGFLLSGTLGDFKESERLVDDLASSVESIADDCLTLRSVAAEPARRCVHQLESLTGDLIGWLERQQPATTALMHIRELSERIFELEPFLQAPFLVRMKQEQASIRRNLVRLRTLAEGSFVIAGHAIAEITSAFVIVSLLFLELDPVVQDFFFVLAITLLIVYLLALIRALDQPFGAGKRSGIRVPLRPLREVMKRLAGVADRVEAGRGSPTELSPIDPEPAQS